MTMEVITNRDVYKHLKDGGQAHAVSWIKQQWGKHQTIELNENKLKWSVRCMKNNIQTYMKYNDTSTRSAMDTFLSEKFPLPDCEPPIQKYRNPAQEYEHTSRQLCTLMTQGHTQAVRDVSLEKKVLQNELNTTQLQLNESDSRAFEMKVQNDILTDKVSQGEKSLEQCKEKVDNVTSEYDKHINAVINENTELRTNNDMLEKSVGGVQQMVAGKNQKLKQVRFMKTYYESIAAKERGSKDDQKELIDSLTTENVQLKEEVKTVKSELKSCVKENEFLRDLLKDSKQVEIFDTSAGTFTPECRKCIYSLLQYQVTSSNIGKVIECVLQLANKVANTLPSRTTINTMNIERLVLAQQQLAEEMLNKENLTLISDEASKYGHKVEGFHVYDESGVAKVLGLREIVTKKSEDMMTVFKEILCDIGQSALSADNKVSKDILLKIYSTMSDRAATQVKFNSLLEEYRTEILKKDLGPAWNMMSPTAQQNVSRLSHFFCGLHTLVHLAEAAQTSLVTGEDALYNGDAPIYDRSFKSSSEPGSIRLIRTASKAFARGGDEKNGAHLPFQDFCHNFLKGQNLRTLPLERFRGNRFNIVFSNASALFLLLPQMKAYLEFDCSNRLMYSVKHDIGQEVYLAGVKALGLICHLITVPLWCEIERNDSSVLSMNDKYQEVLNLLDSGIAKVEDFVAGNITLSFCDAIKLENDVQYQALMEKSGYDGKVCILLQLILPAMSKSLRHMIGDHLPGGKFDNPSEELKEKTRSVPKPNKFSESIFGHMDRLLREKPNSNLISQEAYIMYSHNKTADWLANKDVDELTFVIQHAKHNAGKVLEKFKDRQKDIAHQRRLLVLDKLRAAQCRGEKREARNNKFSDDILHWGLWQCDRQVHMMLSDLTDKEVTPALKAQLNFRRHVLQQKAPSDNKKIFNFTHSVNGKRVPLPVADMVRNVLQLIEVNATLPSRNDPEAEDAVLILYQKVRHWFKQEGVQEDPAVKVQNPYAYLTPHIGRVISQVPGYPAWFNVKYDEEDGIFTYKLLDDYKNDPPLLEIVPESINRNNKKV